MTANLSKEYLQHWHEQGATYETYLDNAGDLALPWREANEQAKLSDA